MTQRIPLDAMTSDDLDRLYDQLERAQRVALQALDDTAYDRTATAQPAGTRIHDGTPSHDLTAWLAGTPHTWAAGRLILHSPDGDTQPEPGWWLIRWDDDTVTTASPAVAERVYGADGLWGRIQQAEEQLALTLAEKKQCSAQQWPQRLARAETALARIQAIADDHPAGIDTALIHAALPDRPAATQATEPPKEN